MSFAGVVGEHELDFRPQGVRLRSGRRGVRVRGHIGSFDRRSRPVEPDLSYPPDPKRLRQRSAGRCQPQVARGRPLDGPLGGRQLSWAVCDGLLSAAGHGAGRRSMRTVTLQPGERGCWRCRGSAPAGSGWGPAAGRSVSTSRRRTCTNVSGWPTTSGRSMSSGQGWAAAGRPTVAEAVGGGPGSQFQRGDATSRRVPGG